MDLLKSLKNLIGMNESVEEDEYDDFEEDEIEEEEEVVEDKKPKMKVEKKENSDKIDPTIKAEVKTENRTEVKIEPKIAVKKEEELDENCHTIFIDPHSFSDCKKIADYIKKDRMVTLNLEYLNTETAQRMMDFIMGAMVIKEANFIEISKKVYTSVPKSVKVHYDGRKAMTGKVYMDNKE